MTNQLKSKSKFLTLILRHKPETINATMDGQGWVRCEDIKNNTYNTRKQITTTDLETLVQLDDKNRFSFSECGEMIRANQGHSVEVDLGLTPKQPPKTLYHGTKHHLLNIITKEGLKPMERNYVHLSDDLLTAVSVGERGKGNVIILHVDTDAMFQDGIEFYKSVNGVWLTKEVTTRYLKQLKQ